MDLFKNLIYCVTACVSCHVGHIFSKVAVSQDISIKLEGIRRLMGMMLPISICRNDGQNDEIMTQDVINNDDLI